MRKISIKSTLLLATALLTFSVIMGACSSDDADEADDVTTTVTTQDDDTNDDTNMPSLTGKKWYSTKVDYIEFFENGTNTYKKSYTYVHDRKNDRILFFKSDGTMYDYVNIYVLTETTLTIGKNDFKTYTTTPPKQLCEELEIAYPNWRITVKTGDKVTRLLQSMQMTTR